jgi:oligopeptide/dipeptide ABC transporter ATP-binding protein
MNVLTVTDLSKRFNLEAGFFARFGKFVQAVNGISFTLAENETYGLVGESGCGKTTTARLLVRMYDADSGTIRFMDDTDVGALKGHALRSYREKVKYIFQDPARSLNPRMSVFDVLVSGWRWSPSWPGKNAAREAAAAIMEEVGLSAEDLDRRPADFSGGQRQRISIARGLLMEPRVLICDEVVSALDVSIQGQILNLLLDIRKRRGISLLFIAHDLKVSSWFCDRIGVMYRGELMEEADARELYRSAAHPYTRLLFESAGSDPAEAGAEQAAGSKSDEMAVENPATVGTPTGCVFAARCPLADERCRKEKPGWRELSPGHRVRCFTQTLLIDSRAR